MPNTGVSCCQFAIQNRHSVLRYNIVSNTISEIISYLELPRGIKLLWVAGLVVVLERSATSLSDLHAMGVFSFDFEAPASIVDGVPMSALISLLRRLIGVLEVSLINSFFNFLYKLFLIDDQIVLSS